MLYSLLTFHEAILGELVVYVFDVAFVIAEPLVESSNRAFRTLHLHFIPCALRARTLKS